MEVVCGCVCVCVLCVVICSQKRECTLCECVLLQRLWLLGAGWARQVKTYGQATINKKVTFSKLILEDVFHTYPRAGLT